MAGSWPIYESGFFLIHICCEGILVLLLTSRFSLLGVVRMLAEQLILFDIGSQCLLSLNNDRTIKLLPLCNPDAQSLSTSQASFVEEEEKYARSNNNYYYNKSSNVQETRTQRLRSHVLITVYVAQLFSLCFWILATTLKATNFPYAFLHSVIYECFVYDM